MFLKELSVLNYKNIEEAFLEFSPKINCLVGHNGEGKTNLLDAIYYLSFCKSSDNPNDSQIIRHEAGSMMLQGRYVLEDESEEKVSCGLKRHQKKVFKRNGKEYARLSEHIGNIRLVMVSPYDTELIIGGSEMRRKFMDMVISQYDARYLSQVIRYRKAMQQRNVLLRAEVEPDDGFISVYEHEMAEAAGYIYRQRCLFFDGFNPLFHEIYAGLAGKDECVELLYKSHCHEGPLLDQLRESRPKDRIMGYSLRGIHRDDIDMLLRGFPIKREGSQGQGKTFVISLKLAQFAFLKDKGNRRVPILLFDDIFDKLDAARVGRIVNSVSGDAFGQIFITDTSRGLLGAALERTEKDFRFFHVEKGVIRYEA